MADAEIISIGDELLSGLTVNTNATWLAAQLYELGFPVNWITTISDDPSEINDALEQAHKRAEIVVVTGGLGPTPDDITRQAIARFFNQDLILHEKTLTGIRKLFETRNLKMPESNRIQAMIPQNATILENPVGTAPGLFILKNAVLYFFLPGVPTEMKQIFSDSVYGLIKEHFIVSPPVFHLIRTTGIPESHLIEKIADILPRDDSIQLSFLPKTSGVDIRVRLRRRADKIEPYESLIQQLTNRLEENIYTESESSLVQIVSEQLRIQRLSLSVAESFTGGYISDLLTNIPGCSDYLMAGVVTYSNQSKIEILGVKQETLAHAGAVSEAVAREMVVGVQQKFGTDCAISSTGVAGPGGGTQDKPVGLGYLAAVCHREVLVKKYYLGRDRRMIKERGAAAGLDLLRRLLMNQNTAKSLQ